MTTFVKKKIVKFYMYKLFTGVRTWDVLVIEYQQNVSNTKVYAFQITIY